MTSAGINQGWPKYLWKKRILTFTENKAILYISIIFKKNFETIEKENKIFQFINLKKWNTSWIKLTQKKTVSIKIQAIVPKIVETSKQVKYFVYREKSSKHLNKYVYMVSPSSCFSFSLYNAQWILKIKVNIQQTRCFGPYLCYLSRWNYIRIRFGINWKNRQTKRREEKEKSDAYCDYICISRPQSQIYEIYKGGRHGFFLLINNSMPPLP